MGKHGVITWNEVDVSWNRGDNLGEEQGTREKAGWKYILEGPEKLIPNSVNDSWQLKILSLFSMGKYFNETCALGCRCVRVGSGFGHHTCTSSSTQMFPDCPLWTLPQRCMSSSPYHQDLPWCWAGISKCVCHSLFLTSTSPHPVPGSPPASLHYILKSQVHFALATNLYSLVPHPDQRLLSF